MKHIKLRVIYTYVTEVGSPPKPLPFRALEIHVLHDNYVNGYHSPAGVFTL
jgi:hypothetical protein